MNAWIFQTNAARVDLERYLSESPTLVWGVGRFGPRVVVGDRAYLWRANGGTREEAGILGVATVVAPSEYREHNYPPCLRDERLQGPKLRAVLRLDRCAWLPRALVKRLPAMERHPIVTANQGCAFTLTAEQADELDAHLAPA